MSYTRAEAGKGGQEPLSKKEISPCPGFPNCNNFPWANQRGARQTHQIRKVNTRRGRGRRRRRTQQPPPKATVGEGSEFHAELHQPSQPCLWEGREDAVPGSPSTVKPPRVQRAALEARWPECIATCSQRSIPFSGRNTQITSQSLAHRGELQDPAGVEGQAEGAEQGCLQTCQPLLCKRNSEMKGLWQAKPQMSFEVSEDLAGLASAQDKRMQSLITLSKHCIRG